MTISPNRAIIATIAFLALTAPAEAAHADDPPPGQPISVTVVAINGTGCRADSYDIAARPDNTGFTLSYRDFRARIGDGAAPTDFRKNCQVAVRVDAPKDYAYAIVRTDSHGTASIGAGMTGTHRTITYFSGGGSRPWRTFPFRGVFTGVWTTTDSIPPEERVYVPCGSAYQQNLSTELRVGRTPSNPVVVPSVMSLDTAFYGLAWKRCG